MNWLDWLIVAIVVLSAFQGLRYGLVSSVAKLVGVLAGLWAAFTFYQPLAQYLSIEWNLEERILPLVKGLLKFWLPAGNSVSTALSPGSTATGGLFAASQFNPFGDYLAGVFALKVLEALSFLALLLATAWVVNLAGFFLTRIAAICLMGPLNRVGGLLFGAVRGLAVVVIVLVLIAPFQRAQTPTAGSPGAQGAPLTQGGAFQGSKLAPYFETLLNTINLPLSPPLLKDNSPTVPVKSV